MHTLRNVAEIGTGVGGLCGTPVPNMRLWSQLLSSISYLSFFPCEINGGIVLCL